MPSRLREPFGKAGLIVAIVALVAALAGGAYAADQATDSAKKRNHKAKKKQKGVTVAQVRKIAKQEARKYANSNPGPAGPQGPAGPAGPAGANGSDGQNGSNGSNGSNGVSVSSTSLAEGNEDCEFGGSEFDAANGTTFACNGEPGEPGIEGQPWTPDGTLPEGATETGSYWIASETGTGPYFGYAIGNISFPIPLADVIPSSNAIFVAESAAVPSDCENPANEGAASAENPEAKPGFLCVFEGSSQGMEAGEFLIQQAPIFLGEGAGVAGAMLAQVPEEAGAFGEGTWAVTGAVSP